MSDAPGSCVFDKPKWAKLGVIWSGMLSAMDIARRAALIQSMEEAIKETEGRVASGEKPITGGYGGGAIPEPLPLEDILEKQKKALLDLKMGKE